jgi:hypothetical protein
MKQKIWLNIKSHFNNNKTKLLIGLLFGIIAISLMAPMASSKIIPTNDHTSHISYVVQAKLAMDEGQFPLRVAPLEDFGLRYPGFQFYSQFPYTLGGLIYKFLTPSNPYTAYKISLWLALWCGGIFMYRLGNWLTRSQIAAILGGVAYMSAPYFLNNIHARGAFTEAIAQGILPMVLFYTWQNFYQPTFLRIILGSLAWFALATSHIITFVYSSLFIVILGTIFKITQKSPPTLSKTFPILQSYLWGWLLALYFLAPVILETKYLSIRKQIDLSNPFYSNDMTPLANLLSPSSMPFMPTELGVAPTYGLHPAIGWIFLAAFGTVIYYHLNNQVNSTNLEQVKPWTTPLLGIFLLSLFLTWSPINFWNLLPKQLWVTQFTFRFLTHIMWSGAILTTLAVIFLFRRRLGSRHLVLGILIIVITSRPWLPIPRGTDTVENLLKEPLFRHTGALDYLYQTPLESLYGNAELRLFSDDWTPSYPLWDAFVDRRLVSETENTYPRWQPNEKPILVISGEVPIENINGQAKLRVLIDNNTIAEIPLTQKQLDVKVPFNDKVMTGKDFKLKFVVDGTTHDGQPLYIRMKHLYLNGLSPANSLLSVEQTKQFCQQDGSTTQCSITIDGKTGLAQLPVLYYPKMQKIWVDNQQVSGFPTNFWDTNLVGLKLPSGTHEVRVKFVGLEWANWVSLVAWLSLALSSLVFGFKSVLRTGVIFNNK